MKIASLPLLNSNKKEMGSSSYGRISKKLILLLTISVCCGYVYYKCKDFGNEINEDPEHPKGDSAEIIDGTPAPPVSEYLLSEESERLTRKIPVSHVFVASAYYYPTSKSLGNNAVAFNMVVDSKNFDISKHTYNFVGSNGTHTESGFAISQIEEEEMCRYAPTVARGNTVENLKKLELESGGTKVEIPFKMARYTAPKPVIICISPQFVAEQWQIFLMHAHTAHRFGAHIHIYVISIVKAYFELMKEYERQGYLTIEKWMRMKFDKPGSQYFEPNLNTELRNQAGALTDCLLQYKEAAEYIAFFDLDDVLFPLNYPTYLEEFNAEYAQKPDATSLVYGRREHEFIKAETLAEYDFHELVASLKTSYTRAGKVVVKPDRHNTTWIHASHREDPTKRIHIKTPHLIHVQRPIQKNGNNEIKDMWKSRFWRFNETIHEVYIAAIHEDIQRMKKNKEVARIAKRLPSRDFYFPVVFKCYLKRFYGRKLTECPNAEKCVMPQRKDIKCMHTDAEYFSGPSSEPFTFHYFTNPFWSSDYGCYQ
ncbi:hypothetical protein L3Y34_007214 [Caenorhabditis briggsae]|uniref:Glycosyltransferase family 92 protein n=2 Tax=Caenorhabditis briggsae TaxID=6238 RepID=A0AAE9A3F0_CAEBR|nr:hypothetical protein L3Y34_007214 [Caenorhabditis briggsae]